MPDASLRVQGTPLGYQSPHPYVPPMPQWARRAPGVGVGGPLRRRGSRVLEFRQLLRAGRASNVHERLRYACASVDIILGMQRPEEQASLQNLEDSLSIWV